MTSTQTPRTQAISKIAALIKSGVDAHEIGRQATKLATPEVMEATLEEFTEGVLISRRHYDPANLDAGLYDGHEASYEPGARAGSRLIAEAEEYIARTCPFTNDGVVPPEIAEELADFIEAHGHGPEAGNKARELVKRLPGGRMKFQGSRAGEPYFNQATQQDAYDNYDIDERVRAASQIILAATAILQARKAKTASA